jgi:hypothetical protein
VWLGPLGVALTAGAVIPNPEQLLPDDTLVLLTAPDFAKLRQLRQDSPKGRLWNDPAMRPFKDKFLSRWREEFLKPLERDLNLSLDTYGNLPQGQLTFAITRNDWQGNDQQPLGFLLLLDAREQSGLLRTNLAGFRKKWVAAGKTLRIDKIRNLDFTTIPFTSNDVPRTLSKLIWRPPVFPPLTGGPDVKQGPVAPSGQRDMFLDLFTVLLTASKELVIGQVDSLLIVGNSTKGVEKVVVRLTGGAIPPLASLASFQASQQALFREAPFYGWVNVKAFVDAFARKSAEPKPPDPADPLEPLRTEQLIRATGLPSCNTLAIAVRASAGGYLLHLLLAAPEASRQGPFQVLAVPAKEANPPFFVPAEAVDFLRWRMDGPRAWATFEKMLSDLSPQALSAVNLILDTAGARAKQDDPGFDLKKALLANLGDDIITYQRPPRGTTPADLENPPTLLLLGSPNPEHLAISLKRLFVIFPQGDAAAEREFLGRKIFSVPVPPMPFVTATPSRPAPPRTLSCAAGASYVALSTDVALLEEYLRSSESQAKALREKAGLVEAAQQVGGMGTGLFGYENQVDTMRAAFEAVKLDPGASTNGIGPSLFPALPALTGPEANLITWMDFTLLPPFERVAPYFSFTVYALSANADGLTLKLFAPAPAGLRNNLVTEPAK